MIIVKKCELVLLYAIFYSVFFQDSLVKPVPKCQAILDFAAAGDGGGNSRLQSFCHIISTMPTLNFYRPKALPVAQPTLSKA